MYTKYSKHEHQLNSEMYKHKVCVSVFQARSFALNLRFRLGQVSLNYLLWLNTPLNYLHRQLLSSRTLCQRI